MSEDKKESPVKAVKAPVASPEAKAAAEVTATAKDLADVVKDPVADGSLDDVQAAAEAGTIEGEVVIDQLTPPDMVKVKNIAKVNIFHSGGKILANCEGFCSEEDANLLQSKELAIKI